MLGGTWRWTSFRGGLKCGAGGLFRDALYLVRPDGYIAFAAGGGSAAELASYLDARRLKPFAALGQPEHPVVPPQPQAVPL